MVQYGHCYNTTVLAGEKQTDRSKVSWVPASHIDPAAYQEMIAQQIKMLQLQQQMVATPSDVNAQVAMFQQNPMFFQQMQQYLWLQQQYHQQQQYPQQQPPQQFSQQQFPQQQSVVMNRPVDASNLSGYPQQARTCIYLRVWLSCPLFRLFHFQFASDQVVGTG